MGEQCQPILNLELNRSVMQEFWLNGWWPSLSAGTLCVIRMLILFLQKYTTSMEFVRKFERQCGSQASVKRLRSHPSYHSFNNKWNLPVYFQIRLVFIFLFILSKIEFSHCMVIWLKIRSLHCSVSFFNKS